MHVRAVNYGAVPFTGWQRGTMAFGGSAGSSRGRTLGDGDATQVDVWIEDLKPGETRDVPVGKSDTSKPAPPVLSDGEVQSYLGGVPTIAGVPMDLVELKVEAQAFVSTFRAFILDAVWVDLWLVTYPGQPWSKGVVSFNRCNFERGDWSTHVPEHIELTLANALVHVLGRGYGAPLLIEDESLADASRRSFPVTIVWPEMVNDPDQAGSSTVDAERQVHVFGLQPSSFGLLGAISVTPPTDGYALQHLRRNLPEAVEDLHTTRVELDTHTAYTAHGELGPAARSGQTGAQEEQPGWTQMSEAFWPGGVGVHHLRWLVALNQGQQTLHYREKDGSPLSLDRQGLNMWDARPHWHMGFSPDQLGKVQPAPDGWNNGWSGPDREHWFIATLGAAYLATGCRCLQQQLDAHARVFLYSITTDPKLTTSTPGRARAVGWTSLVACWLWKTLEDRKLAESVRQRWREWMEIVCIPRLMPKPGEKVHHWDYFDDPRVWHDMGGKKDYQGAWMPYQQAVGAGGVYIAARMFGHDGARGLAFSAAKAVIEYGYTFAGDAPIEWDYVAFRQVRQPISQVEYVENIGAHRSGWFADAWTPMASWVVLKEQPNDTRARAIYNDALMRAELSAGPSEWLPPLV